MRTYITVAFQTFTNKNCNFLSHFLSLSLATIFIITSIPVKTILKYNQYWLASFHSQVQNKVNKM